MNTKMSTKKKKSETNPVGENPSNPSAQEEIASFAYVIWEQEGRPHGQDVMHWLQAEIQVLQAGKPDAGQPAPTAAKSRKKAAPKAAS